jgi:hypothetical protein
MGKERVTTVGLDRAAAEDAKALLAELRALGTKTSRDELVRALVWGTTAPQAAGMIMAYIMHTETHDAGR